MRNTCLSGLLSVMFAICLPVSDAVASHALGASITYECLGGNQYRLRLVFYRDCAGIAAPTSPAVSISSSCGNMSVPMTLQPPEPAFPPFDQYLAPYELPVYCAASNCGSGSMPGLQEYVYEGVVTLPPCANWTMSYELCCRSASINTINSPGSQDIYVNAFLNNAAAPSNNSPQFDVPARGFLCLNDDNTIVASATDPDGDLLVYTLYTPWNGSGSSVNYNGGYTANNPLNNNYFTFIDGIINVWPTSNGQITVIGIMVEEYRNGILIGRIVRDMQVRVINNCPANPGDNFDIDQDGIFDSDTVVLCADNPVQLDVYLDNVVAGRNYSIVAENLADFPGATFNTTPDPSSQGSVIGHFIWTPSPNAIGTSQVLIFTAFDDNCPVVGFANFTYEFIITGLELDVAIDTVAISCTDSVQMSTIVSNGTPPYSYLWNDGSVNPNRWVTAGIYHIEVTDDEGCTGRDSVTVYYIDDPVAMFVPANGCVDSSITFIDQSYSNFPAGYPPLSIVDWNWDFGDGSTLTGVQNPGHVFSANGNYTVQLISTNDLGCVDTVEHSVWANPAPDVHFTFENVCQDTLYTFTDQSVIDTGQIVAWGWDFGDGSDPVQTQNTVHQFTGSGNYSVTLLALSDSACPSLLTRQINVFPLPVADFSPTDVCHGNVSSFIDQSVVSAGSLEVWQWDFGDGSVSSLQNPVHSYGDTGVFDVTLIAFTDSVCGDTITQQVTVHPTPVAGFFNDTLCADLAVQFTDTSSITSGTITSWGWYFGDGDQASAQNTSHVYGLGGNYTGSLVVQSALGCIDTVSHEVTVYPRPTAAFASLAACLNDTTLFVDQSTVAAGSQVVGWDWDFGDNSGTSTSQYPSYAYAASGVFSVTMVAETNRGCLDTITHSTEVYDLPVAAFTFDNECLYDAAVFQNTSSIPSGSIVANEWDFGDGDNSSDQQPVGQTYLAPGFYDVELITESNHGCLDTVVQQIEMYPVPTAMFSFDSVCFPFSTNYVDASTIGGGYAIAEWEWKFGDGFVESGVQNPQHAYASWGDYYVELTVTSDVGCVGDTMLGPARVYPHPEADFPDDIANCLNDTTVFEDMSSVENWPTDMLTDWLWDFADAQVSTDQNTSHVFQTAGFFDVALAVTTNHGCQDTAMRPVEIYPLPDVKFTVDTNAGCQPFRAWFFDQTEIPDPYILSQWEWNFGDGSPSVSAQHPHHTYWTDTLGYFDVAQYSISLQVISANGCVNDTVYENYMTEYPKPDAMFAVDPQRSDILFPKFRITDLSSPNVVSWLYTLGNGDESTDQHPVYEYQDTGRYQIVQYVTTEYGCTDTADFTVIVDPEFEFYIPSAFTPDANGKNEEFFGSGIGIKTFSMYIYDRWGELIFRSDNPDLHWDGTYKGQQVKQGVYVYYFNIWDVKGEPHIYRGNVTLFR